MKITLQSLFVIVVSFAIIIYAVSAVSLENDEREFVDTDDAKYLDMVLRGKSLPSKVWKRALEALEDELD
ncbi:hypothetical protein HOLleu_39066 [Holothuria leucospilota]|uniref:Uncharacterized protein n=1 Tax=Holothuria leucospilota TaxID=206669 RepID=A0A9Q0YFF2_HOLLE|nr:hypothetical protein HOLleu_39066 [Holothuria leucospilota]